MMAAGAGHSGGRALLDALAEAGVPFIFANFGSDHPAIIEAIAEARAAGRPIPRVITCPNEMVALSAAQGAAQVSGRAQAVLVHVDCGTQALGGAVHNAARGRTPVLIFAGLAPATQEGEHLGSRNEFIHWVQDVPDQPGIVRQYLKYESELRSPANVRQIVHRALQIAQSEPKGPVYLSAAREVLEASAPPVAIDPRAWRPVPPSPLPAEAVGLIAGALMGARRPLVVTSYLGRRPEAVAALAGLCHRLGVGVMESVPSAMSFPHDDPLYQGSHWNQPFQNRALAEADVVLVIDSDVPWIPAVNRPDPAATVFHIDVDPLKPSIPLWYIGARASLRADAETALLQLCAHLDAHPADEAAVEERRRHYGMRHEERAKAIARAEVPAGDGITPEFLTAAIRRRVGEEAIVLNEGITNYPAISDHMGRTRPGTMFASGGSSLGWSGGAAVGARLAAPGRLVVALTGDGSYLFSQPSTVHWMARRYACPFLQVVYDNGGWRAPRFSTLAVHPDGHASRAADLDIGFDPAPDHAAIAAAAGGAFARTIERAEDVAGALAEAMAAVEGGRAAVVNARLQRPAGGALTAL
jgi:acetolactate synthase-1/2/3 large subunit